ncbi:MAG: PspC domain-containing protein [Leeuwenhoekiella sp.]
MNKTININLAGLFFHIDENAYAKLQRYLDAIKRSFTDSQGRDEIIQDIEARVAELFSERVKNERQVIGLKEVDEVIEIMGQPEDYRLDDEIFEDEPKTMHERTPKKLYRDSETSWIAGICSGLGHYMGVDAVWVRLALTLLTIFTWGGFVIIYIAFWIFVPEARTTTEKLEMRGKPVNIDNIQRKVKEGFDNVADTVKNVDYEKYSNKARRGAGGFFNTIGKILIFFLTAFVKFIGIILIIVGALTVIGLFIGLFTAGTLGFMDGDLSEYIDFVNITEAPLWLISMLSFFLLAIPFFCLFYLGLKILVDNLKSMSRIAKLSLLGIWLIAFIGILVLGIRQAIAFSVDGEISTTEVLNIQPSDTLKVRMVGAPGRENSFHHSNNWKIDYKNNQKVIYNQDIRLIVKESQDNRPQIEILKSSQGRSYDDARNRAQNIDYNYNFDNNTLTLNGYFTTALKDKHRDQEIQVTLFLPEGAKLIADKNTYSYHRNDSRYGDLLKNGSEGNFLIMDHGALLCPECPEKSNNEVDDSGEWQYNEYEGNDAPENYDYDEQLSRKKDAIKLPEDQTDTLNMQLDTTRIE